MTIEISRVVIGMGWVHTCLWISSATGLYLAQLFNKQKRCMWKVVGTGRLFLPTIILRLTLGGGS